MKEAPFSLASQLFVEYEDALIPEYRSLRGELEAVGRGTKKMSKWEEPRDHRRVSPDYEEGISLAIELGLTISHLSIDGMPDYVAVYVTKPEETWRAYAHRVFISLVYEHGWTETVERFQSMLLGYSPAQIEEWIRAHKRNKAGWSGITVFFLLSSDQKDKVETAAGRCIPEAAAADGVTAFYFVGNRVLDAGAGASCAPWHVARCALSNIGVKNLFAGCDGYGVKGSVARIELGTKDTRLFNSSLLSNVEFLIDKQWR